jgi:hypothetical protein
MTESEAYHKNTKEQYEMLGRFVEAFEMMVHEVREASIELAARDGRNRGLLEIVFHHQGLSAKPLFDIFRGLVAAILQDSIDEQSDKKNGISNAERPLMVDGKGNIVPFTIKDRDTFLGVLSHLQRIYGGLSSKRNDLLHGTWFVGYPSHEDPFSEEFYIRRLTTTKRGLAVVTDLPKNAPELKKLSEQCEGVRNWIGWLVSCLEGTLRIADAFKFEGQTWWFVTPGGSRSTLL